MTRFPESPFLLHHLPSLRRPPAGRPHPLRRAWRAGLLPLAALLLAPLLLLACTGQNIGGVDSGWNALAVSGGQVFIGTKDGQVAALADRGFEGVRHEWTFPPGEGSGELEGAFGSPLVVGGRVIISAQNGYVYALNTENGRVDDRGWRRPQGQPQNLQPLVAGPAYDPINNLVLAPSEDGRLYNYLADSGLPLWDAPFEAGDKIWSTPAVADGVAYFGSHDHKIYAVSTHSGQEIWSYQTGGVVAGRPLIFRDLVIAGSFDKKLYALNARDGSPVWEFEGENWFWAGAVSNGEQIFAPSMDGVLYALNDSGSLQWSYDIGSAIVSPPALVPRGLVIAGVDGKLSLLDVSRGLTGTQREVSTSNLGQADITAPLFAVGDSVYVGSQDGSVRRVEVKGGQVQMWCWEPEDGRCD